MTDNSRTLERYEEQWPEAEEKNSSDEGQWLEAAEPEYDEQLISVRMYQIESCRERLAVVLEELHRDYDNVAYKKKQEFETMLVEWSTFAAVTVVLGMLIVAGITRNVISAVPSAILLILVVPLLLFFLSFCIQRTFGYLIRCGTKPSRYVETYRVYTYAGEENHLLQRMRKLREHMKMLDAMEVRLKKYGDLSKQDIAFTSNPLLLRTQSVFSYTTKKVWIWDWIKAMWFQK